MFARGVRNVIYNYTEAQRKVRSATSNDAWGPSPALMHEIADLTDNVVAYSEIMPIIWKRLNDHGKNWRHVYKSLVLLDHLVRYGNERVSQQCKENIFAIQTLKDFQYVEDQKDQGFNVREKAKQLVSLLKDDERLRNERQKAQEARERYARQAMGMDSHGAVTYGRPATSGMRRNSAEGGDGYGSSTYDSNPYADMSAAQRSSSHNGNLYAASSKDFVQPSSQEEEQLQMQIALAESQREAEDEERRRRNDDLKLKLALERSVTEKPSNAFNAQGFDLNGGAQALDPPFFDVRQQQNDPFFPSTTAQSSFGWTPSGADLSSQSGFKNATNDPWSSEVKTQSSAAAASGNNDPWQTGASTALPNPWGASDSPAANNNTGLSVNLNDPWGVGASDTQPKSTATNKTIDNELSEFFGASANISAPFNAQQQTSSNPWNTSTFPSTSNSSLPASNPSNTSSNLLYPTITGVNPSKSNTSSPVPAALSASRKTPESFLGEDFSNLVNLDQLVTDPKSTNPFGSSSARVQNPFANLTKPPTLEQLSSSNNTGFITGSTLPPPLIPSSFNANTSSTPTNNPFM